MSRSYFVLACGLCSFTGVTLAGIMSASAQVAYIDEGAAYTVPPAYVAPAVPPAYYVAPQGYAAPVYTAPAAPLALVPIAPPAYSAAPAYVERVVPGITPRERVTRRVIVERRPAYPRYDYGYVTYEEW
jgi:hypothetical protein